MGGGGGGLCFFLGGGPCLPPLSPPPVRPQISYYSLTCVRVPLAVVDRELRLEMNGMWGEFPWDQVTGLHALQCVHLHAPLFFAPLAPSCAGVSAPTARAGALCLPCVCRHLNISGNAFRGEVTATTVQFLGQLRCVPWGVVCCLCALVMGCALSWSPVRVCVSAKPAPWLRTACGMCVPCLRPWLRAACGICVCHACARG